MSVPAAFINAIQRTSVPQFKYFSSIDSTNLIALEWLENSAPDGSIVFADHQRSGRGRFDRNWITQPGSAIAVSIIVRPELHERKYLPLFSPLAGIALTDVLKHNLQIDAQIKWPNDVLINRMKTSGILTESVWNGEELLGLVVGIGVNVLPKSIPTSENLQFPATCLQDHSQFPIDRFDVLAALINAFYYWRSQIHLPEFMNQWQKTLAFHGEKVYIKQKDGSVQITGTLSGLTSNGDLEILSENNQKQTITVGDVHLRPTGPEN
ncbi:MAG: biotin--[acetyl-CoA-carboxylase] ligase [Chloroflexi bacterium HGW-Chloroflexi-3]|nr:MAG: biotin--[acetyl-CoA-carboxylase] ligase [Chloroflexi bacterium HGW-Chloroflexi-3]